MQLADMTVMVNVIHGMVGFDRPFSQLTKVADLFPEIEKRIVFAEALEQAFRIEFESEEISAWGTLQNVVDSVVNQLDARRQVDDELTQISPEKIEAMRVETIKKHMPMYGTDVGHGHVWKRPDGSRARCGGPTICKTCANDLAWVEAAKKGEDVPTVVEADNEIEPVIKPPINRIEHKDVEDFRTGNYTVRNALNQYQHIALKSAIYPGKGTPFGLMYTALGLAEAGEVQNKVKKGFRDDNWIEFHGAVSARGREVVFNPVKPERREQITKELRGLLWYIAATASELDITLHDIALGNLEELCGRTDRGTLSGDGDDR